MNRSFTRLASLLLLFALLAGLASAQVPVTPDELDEILGRVERLTRTTGTPRFIAWHEDLTPENVVVLATVKRLTTHGRKRIGADEAVRPSRRLALTRPTVSGRGRLSGSTYYRARGRAEIPTESVLFGAPPATRLRLHLPVQIEKTAEGKTHRLWLGEDPAWIEKGGFGLFVLRPKKRPRGHWEVVRWISHPIGSDRAGGSRAAFTRRAADYQAVNAAIRRLRDAVDAADGFLAADRPGRAAAVLKAALDAKPKIRDASFEDEAAVVMRPYRQKAARLECTARRRLAPAKPDPAARRD